MVEILRNGGPIHPYDTHFQFGFKKAELMLAALPVISEFAANTHEDGSTTVESQVIMDEVTGSQFSVWVEMHEYFVHSSGERIERPWLNLQALSDDIDTHIGLGVQKAKAIRALSAELTSWVGRRKAARQRAAITIRLPRLSPRPTL